jgi:DNA invertase Pin-like site-specific DNA recombinase
VIAVPDGARLVGYARVSIEGQDLALQIDALRNHGVANGLIFSDKASGAKYDRPGLDACFGELRSGDILLVWRLDRLGRSVRHLVTLIDQLRDRNVGFRSVCDGAIDTTTPSGELIFHVFSALAQFERRLIQERTNAGIAAARARGRRGGRPPLTPDSPKVVLASKLFVDKSVNLDDICATLKISRTTLYRYVELGTGRQMRARDRSD